MEEPELAAGGDRVQFWRIPRGEFRHEASGCGDALREHERIVRHQAVSGWVLRQRLLLQQSSGLFAEHERRLVYEPLPEHETGAGNGQLGYLPGCELQVCGDFESKRDSALARRVER